MQRVPSAGNMLPVPSAGKHVTCAKRGKTRHRCQARENTGAKHGKSCNRFSNGSKCGKKFNLILTLCSFKFPFDCCWTDPIIDHSTQALAVKLVTHASAVYHLYLYTKPLTQYQLKNTTDKQTNDNDNKTNRKKHDRYRRTVFSI